MTVDSEYISDIDLPGMPVGKFLRSPILMRVSAISVRARRKNLLGRAAV